MDKDTKKVNINIRVSESTKKDIVRLAEIERRSVSDYIRLQIEKIAANSTKKSYRLYQ